MMIFTVRRPVRCCWRGWLLACFTSHQHSNVSQGRICSDKCTCCHTEIENCSSDLLRHQSQYTDTAPTSPSPDPVRPDAWQDRHQSTSYVSHWYDTAWEKPNGEHRVRSRVSSSAGGHLTTRPPRQHTCRHVNVCWLLLFVGCWLLLLWTDSAGAHLQGLRHLH